MLLTDPPIASWQVATRDPLPHSGPHTTRPQTPKPQHIAINWPSISVSSAMAVRLCGKRLGTRDSAAKPASDGALIPCRSDRTAGTCGVEDGAEELAILDDCS
jgi:hypothetical protein